MFTKRRLWVMDRNFPGVARIRRLVAVTHVLVRLKSDITVTKDRRVPARRVLHGRYRREGPEDPDAGHRVLRGRGRPGRAGDVLPGHRPGQRAALPGRPCWPPRISGGGTGRRPRCARPSPRSAAPGPSTGPIFRSQPPDLIRQEHAAWITACELARAAARAAARSAAPARKGRRAGKPVHPREISFTAARRAAITTTRNGTATAGLPAPLTTAATRCRPPRPGQAPRRHRPGPAP